MKSWSSHRPNEKQQNRRTEKYNAKMNKKKVRRVCRCPVLFRNKSTSYNLHGLARIDALYIPEQWGDALTGSSAAAAAAAAGAERDHGLLLYSKSKEALHLKQRLKQRDREKKYKYIYILKKNYYYSAYSPLSLLFPVRGWSVSVDFACSGIWDRYPQAAAHSRASGSPAVASQAEDRKARPRCPPPGIRQARSQRNPPPSRSPCSHYRRP